MYNIRNTWHILWSLYSDVLTEVADKDVWRLSLLVSLGLGIKSLVSEVDRTESDSPSAAFAGAYFSSLGAIREAEVFVLH